MKKRSQQDYQRLPGKAVGLYRRARLWQGQDHLLLVDSNTYQENYERFYYKDIQGLLIRKTIKGGIWNGLVGVPAVLTAMKLWVSWEDGEGWLWALPTALLLLMLLVNTLRGSTCVSHIQTPISVRQLPSLNRLRIAHKVRDRIRTLVEQEQGRLEREQIRQAELPPRAEMTLTENGNRLAVTHTDITQGTTETGPLYSGWGHWLLVAGCLAMAGFLVLYLFLNGPVLAGIGVLLGGCLLVINLIALAKQGDSSAPSAVKSFAWSVLIFLFILLIVGYFGMMFALIQSGQMKAMFGQWSLFRAMAQLSPLESPFLSALFILAAISLVLIALFGSIAVAGWRRRPLGAEVMATGTLHQERQ
jgi:hypothetical protein